MDYDVAPPILETKQVLLSHLKAKIQSVKNIAVSEELLEEITKDLSNKDIIFLLENENKLIDRIEKSKTCEFVEKQTIGEELFVAVSLVDSELCAQLTGMLLELDIGTIKNLLKDPDYLKQAINKAKQEYLKYSKSNTKYELGEELFELVFDRFSDQELASQLTGMLLELDIDTLQRLTRTPKELDEKLDAAYSVLLNIKKAEN